MSALRRSPIPVLGAESNLQSSSCTSSALDYQATEINELLVFFKKADADTYAADAALVGRYLAATMLCERPFSLSKNIVGKNQIYGNVEMLINWCGSTTGCLCLNIYLTYWTLFAYLNSESVSFQFGQCHCTVLLLGCL